MPLDQIVVLDETYATTKFTRLRGRSPRGKRLKARVPHGHWKLLTILAAITVKGVLTAASIDCAADADVFRVFIDEFLVPTLRPGQVVVMDNLSVHKVSGVAESLARVGCRVVYLPPYSPDLSPIENVFSKLKQSLRTTAARDVPTLHEAIGDAFATITPADCRNCFDACGYSIQRS